MVTLPGHCRPVPLANSFQTKDNRWIIPYYLDVGVYWERFCRAIGHEEIEKDPRFDTAAARQQNNVALIDIIDEAFAQKTLAEWQSLLTELGIYYVVVQKSPEVIKDPQAIANKFFETFQLPVYGAVDYVSSPIKFTETPVKLRTPAPELGQHNEEILDLLGYSRDDLAELRKKQVIN